MRKILTTLAPLGLLLLPGCKVAPEHETHLGITLPGATWTKLMMLAAILVFSLLIWSTAALLRRLMVKVQAKRAPWLGPE